MELQKKPTFPTRTKTIKVEIRTWDSLKSLKKENETFDDVIKDLLNQRTKQAGNDNLKAIKYQRKIAFFDSLNYGETIGFEFEYNDVKSDKSDFILDLKIKKIFFKKRVFNPSEFFGVDNAHKHYSEFFLLIYLRAVSLALKKEFRVEFSKRLIIEDDYEDYINIANWRRLFYEYNISNESFENDIEEPMRLNEEEKPSKKWKDKIENSIAQTLIKNYKRK